MLEEEAKWFEWKMWWINDEMHECTCQHDHL